MSGLASGLAVLWVAATYKNDKMYKARDDGRQGRKGVEYVDRYITANEVERFLRHDEPRFAYGRERLVLTVVKERSRYRPHRGTSPLGRLERRPKIARTRTSRTRILEDPERKRGARALRQVRKKDLTWGSCGSL